MCLRNIAKTLSGCVFALLFCSCVRYDEVVLPSFTEEKFLVEINQEKSILYITHRESHYNFSLFDSFGIPLSSKALENGKLKLFKLKKIAKIIKKKCLFGISLKPNTSEEYLSQLFSIVDLILVMSVEPGKSGQKFLEKTYQRVENLNKIRENQNLKFLIEVDGGINPEIAKNLKNLGADMVVSGNYVFKSQGIKQAITSLKN